MRFTLMSRHKSIKMSFTLMSRHKSIKMNNYKMTQLGPPLFTLLTIDDTT